MTITNEDLNEFNKDVVALCEETTKLHNEVKGQKDRFEQKLVQATSAAGEAQESADAASSHRTSAQSAEITAGSHANRSEQAANRAEQVAGLDTVEQAVDLAMSDFAGLMSESEARAINRINEAKYSASGMVHTGKHYAGSGIKIVNEGIWVAPTTEGFENVITIGRGSNAVGASETDFAVCHIAGTVINLLGTRDNNPANLPEFRFNLPEPEDGARISDLQGDARGSGKASLDLKVDVDPKYGNAPSGTESQILHEALLRVREGACKNADLRYGLDGYSATDPASGSTVHQSGNVVVINTGKDWDGVYLPLHLISGVTYELEFEIVDVGSAVGEGVSLRDVANMSPMTGNDGSTSYWYPEKCGTYKCTFTAIKNHSASERRQRFIAQGHHQQGQSVGFRIISCRSLTEERVTKRVDLAAVEYYEEETDDEIFSCIQSRSNTFGTTGVPTVLSTRKLSYFQQYEGQFPEVTVNPDFINDRYRCVKWSALTESQKREVASYKGESLFKGINGKMVDGRLRARVFRGAGNGDWDNIHPRLNGTAELRFAVEGNVYVAAQGASDSVESFSSAGDGNKYSGSSNLGVSKSGVFTPRVKTSRAYQGRCFLYVVATVPRANKGGNHPNLNPWGTAQYWGDVGGITDSWHHSRIVSSGKPATEADCFSFADFSPTSHIVGKVAPKTGGLSSGASNTGHPDGIYYDGIVGSGLNGVIDWRLGANANCSHSAASKVLSKMENKTYLGLERLVWTVVSDADGVPAGSGSWSGGTKRVIYWNKDIFNLGADTTTEQTSHSYIVDKVTGESRKVAYVTYGATTGRTNIYLEGDLSDVWSGDSYIVLAKPINLTVSGEFGTQMVGGKLVDILGIDAYKNGWMGTWGGEFDGELRVAFSRKSLSNRSNGVSTNNKGGTWDLSTPNIDSVTNDSDFGGHNAPSRVGAYPYSASAKQTTPSKNKPVYNANAGLLGVVVTQSHDKAALAESVSGVILKSDARGIVTEQSNPVKFLVDEVIDRIKTQTTDMVAPTNGSQAVKVAVYQVSDDGQCKLGFIANTMTHNGTDWGELDEIQIPFGSLTSDTFVDKNGITQTSMSSISAISHGWTSNHARAGAQVVGVDL